MAGYRQIHTQIWKDEWFIELEPDEKLLFIYLFSNDLASISGLYKIPIRVICNETCLSREFVTNAMTSFQAAGKIFYQDGVLWMHNMSKYHKNASPYTQAKVAADIASIPDCETKRQYLHGMDTIPTHHSESESNSNSENNSEAVSAPPSNEFENIKSHIEKLTGLLAVPQFIPAINEIVEMGALPEDIEAGYDWVSANKVFKYYSQLVGPTRTAMSKRVGGSSKPKEEHPPGYVEYKGEWIDPRNIPTETY